MKKILFLTLITCAIITSANAQEGEPFSNTSFTATSSTNQELEAGGNTLSVIAFTESWLLSTINWSTGESTSWTWQGSDFNTATQSFPDVAHSITVNSPGTYTATFTSCAGIDEEEMCYGNSTLTITFEVTGILEVPCGNKGEKIAICHKGKTICISRSAVEAHLAHGDDIIPCN